MKNTEVTFHYTCGTLLGERVAILGNISLLGHWDESKAIYLQPLEYPVWTIKLDLPRDKVIEYKYLVVQEDTAGGKEAKWEVLPQNVNRVVCTHGKKEVSVHESREDSA